LAGWANKYPQAVGSSDNMATVEELVVRAKPEGVNQTTKEFDDMQGELEETEQQMDDTAGGFGDLANKWTGALAAITAGLAVAVGGLATQVPVLGSLMSGLGSIISGLALQIDQKLRPTLQPIVNDLFRLGNAIASGDFAKAAQIFKDWGNAIANTNWSQIFTDILNGLVDIRGRALNKLENLLTKDNVESALNAISDAVEGVNWGSAFQAYVDDTTNFLKNVDWLGIAGVVIRFFGRGIANVIKNTDWSKWLKFFVNQVTSFITDVNWMDVGMDIIRGIIDGIGAVTDFAVGGAEDIGAWIAGKFDDAINNAVKWGENLIKNFIKGLKNKIPDLDDTFDIIESEIDGGLEVRVGGGGGGGGNGNNTPRGGIVGGLDTVNDVFIDGRNVTNETGRYRRDATSRRGRNG
jgi:hypothetical protein